MLTILAVEIQVSVRDSVTCLFIQYLVFMEFFYVFRTNFVAEQCNDIYNYWKVSSH